MFCSIGRIDRPIVRLTAIQSDVPSNAAQSGNTIGPVRRTIVHRCHGIVKNDGVIRILCHAGRGEILEIKSMADLVPQSLTPRAWRHRLHRWRSDQ